MTISFDSNDSRSILYRAPLADELRIYEPPSGEVLRELIEIWHSFQSGQTDKSTQEDKRFRR